MECRGDVEGSRVRINWLSIDRRQQTAGVTLGGSRAAVLGWMTNENTQCLSSGLFLAIVKMQSRKTHVCLEKDGGTS